MSETFLNRNLKHYENNVLENILQNNFDNLKELLLKEIKDIDEFSQGKLNFNNHDLENLDKLIDSFIINKDEHKTYSHAMNFLTKYS